MEHEVVPEGFVACHMCICNCFANHGSHKFSDGETKDAKVSKEATEKSPLEAAGSVKADGKVQFQAEGQGFRYKSQCSTPLTFVKAVAQSTLADTHACSLVSESSFLVCVGVVDFYLCLL